MRTRCPACNTVFRVTSEQLRAKAGKVRCGYCQSAFNAFDGLIDDTQATAAPPAEASPELARSPAVVHVDSAPKTNETELEAVSEPVVMPASEMMAETVAVELEPAPASLPEVEREPVAEVGADAEIAASAEPDADEADTPPAEEVESGSPEAAEIALSDVSTATATEEPVAEMTDETPETAAESTLAAREAGLVAVRELAEAPAYNRWAAGTLAGSASSSFDGEATQRVRWPFVVAALMLVAVLSAQLAYYFRSELVRYVPATMDIFDALGVVVPLPAQSELVSIEASDLQADTARGLFVLQASLRNRAAYAQTWPALELTLIDTQDAVVARRVLNAADYLPAGSDLTVFPASAEIPVRLWIDAKGLGAAGYRLYIFYP